MSEKTEKTAEVEEYRQAILHCAMAARLLRLHNIPELLQAISKAEAMGPILDPTLWRDRGRKMQEDKDLLKAALPLWRVGEHFVIPEDQRQ